MSSADLLGAVTIKDSFLQRRSISPRANSLTERAKLSTGRISERGQGRLALSSPLDCNGQYLARGEQPAYSTSPDTRELHACHSCSGATAYTGHQCGVSASCTIERSRTVGGSAVLDVTSKNAPTFRDEEMWSPAYEVSEGPTVASLRAAHRRADGDDAVWALLMDGSPSSVSLSPPAFGAPPSAAGARRATVAGGGPSSSHEVREPQVLRSTSLSAAWGMPGAAAFFSPTSPPPESPAQLATPSPAMALAHPSTSPPPSAAAMAPFDLNASATLGDGGFWMATGPAHRHGSDSPGSLGAPFFSYSYLGVTLQDETPFLLDERWGSGGAEPGSDAAGGQDRGRGDRGDGAAGTEDSPEDALLGSQYFDGMLPMMLQCGEAMLKVQQRKEARHEKKRRERLLQLVRASVATASTTTAPAPPAQRQASVVPSGGLLRGGSMRSLSSSTAAKRDAYALDDYGVMGSYYDSSERTEAHASAGLAALSVEMTDEELLRVLEATDMAALGLDAALISDHSESDSADEEADVFKSDNVSVGSDSVSPAMREVEELMRELDVMPALQSLGDAAAHKGGHEGTAAVSAGAGKRPRGYLLAPVLHSESESAHSDGDGDGDEDLEIDSDVSEDGPVTPLPSSQLHSGHASAASPPLPMWRSLHDADAAASPSTPPHPPPLVGRTSRLHGRPKQRPSARRVPAVEMTMPGTPVVSGPPAGVMAGPPVPLPGDGADGAEWAADKGDRSVEKGGAASHDQLAAESSPATRGSEANRRQRTQRRPQTIADMLRAQRGAGSRVAPFILLVEADGSAQDASLALQRSPRGADGWLTGGGPSSVALADLQRSPSCASPLQQPPSPHCAAAAEEAWQATEKIVFSDAARCTSSRTVREMAQMVASGYNVSLVSLHARRSRPSNFTAWGALLPEFFTSFFRTMMEQDKAPHSFAAKLSVALLKCDLYRDLLSDVVRLTPVALLGTPLLGPRLASLSAAPVSNLAGCLSTLREAHARLSADDYANGSLVVTLSLKQQELDAVTGEQRDVLLSSFTAFASNVDVLSDVLQRERLPASAGLLLQLFRGPVQSAVAVYTRHMPQRPAEQSRAQEVLRVLRGRQTLAPRVGSVVSLLVHIRSELKTFWAVLEASRQQAAERRRVLIDRAVTAARATAVAEAALRSDPPKTRGAATSTPAPQVSAESVAWEDDAYRRERAQRLQLRYALRALSCLSTDCRNVLSDPVSKLPPVYVLSRQPMLGAGGGGSDVGGGYNGSSSRPSRSPRGGLLNDRHGAPPLSRVVGGAAPLRGGAAAVPEEPRRAGGDEADAVSEGSELAAERELDAKNVVVKRDGRRRRPSSGSKGRAGAMTLSEVFCEMDWTPAVPPANLFAGDAACGWHGIRPLFRADDAWLSEAFGATQPAAQLAPMATVAYLEMTEPDRAQGSATASDAAGTGAVGGEGGEAEVDGVAAKARRAKNRVVGFTVNGCPVGPARALPEMPHIAVGELCVRHAGGGGGGTASHSTSPATVRPAAWAGAATSKGDGRVNRMPPLPIAQLTSTHTNMSIHSSSSSTVSSGTSSTVRSAFRGFLDGENISILSVTEASGEADAVTRLMRSPLWLAMRELVETALQGTPARLAATDSSGAASSRHVLYLSITQPLSIDCVKDHLGSSSSSCQARTRRPSSVASLHGVSTNRLLSLPNSEEVMALQSAWTPAGPVVAGARYLPITSVAQFYKITRELPAHVQAVAAERRTEALGGTHVLVSFLLRRAQPLAQASPRGSGAYATPYSPDSGMLSPRATAKVAVQNALSVSSFEHVFFTSATVLLSTKAMFWNSLQLSDRVPASHPLNLFRPTYCHRVVNVVDVAASAVDRAWPLLLTQERTAQHSRFLQWRVPWAVKGYAGYLARHRDALRWCMANLVSQSAAPSPRAGRKAEAAAAPLASRDYHMDLTQAGLPEWVHRLFYGKRVCLADLTAALRQVELMFSGAVDLLESRFPQKDAWADPHSLCNHPMALVDASLVYDVTVPPTTHVRTPLDPMPSATGEASEAAVVTVIRSAAAGEQAPTTRAGAVPSRPSTARLGLPGTTDSAEERVVDALPPSPTSAVGKKAEGQRNGVPAREGAEAGREAALTQFAHHNGCRPDQQRRRRGASGAAAGKRNHETCPDNEGGGVLREASGTHRRSGPVVVEVVAQPQCVERGGTTPAPSTGGTAGAGGATLVPGSAAGCHARPRRTDTEAAAGGRSGMRHKAPPLPDVAGSPPSFLHSTRRRQLSSSTNPSTPLHPTSSSTHSTNRTREPTSPMNSDREGRAASTSVGTPLLLPSAAARRATSLRASPVAAGTPSAPRRLRGAEPTCAVPPIAPQLLLQPARRSSVATPHSPKACSEVTPLPPLSPERRKSAVERGESTHRSSETPGSASQDVFASAATVAFADSTCRPRSAASGVMLGGSSAVRHLPQPPRRAESIS